jgi:hypothetical protein
MVAALFWGLFWFGLIDLLVVVQQDEQFRQDYLFESGWGLLYLILVAVPLVWLVRRPGEPVAIAQLGLVALSVLVGAMWRGSGPQMWNALGLDVTVGLVAWLGRASPVRPARPDPALSALALLGLPAVVYGAPLISNRTQVEDITNGVSHYPMQASLALAVAALVALAAVTRSRLPAWTAALSAGWLGVESMVYPHLKASLGLPVGALAAGWAVLVVAAVEAARRGSRHVDWQPSIQPDSAGVVEPDSEAAPTAPHAAEDEEREHDDDQDDEDRPQHGGTPSG